MFRESYNHFVGNKDNWRKRFPRWNVWRRWAAAAARRGVAAQGGRPNVAVRDDHPSVAVRDDHPSVAVRDAQTSRSGTTAQTSRSGTTAQTSRSGEAAEAPRTGPTSRDGATELAGCAATHRFRRREPLAGVWLCKFGQSAEMSAGASGRSEGLLSSLPENFLGES